jgi:hypothetical protein
LPRPSSYYRDVLGFDVLWIWLDGYGAVHR